MIIRLMGEGQWRVDDSLQGRLNELDDEVGRAVESGDQSALDRELAQLSAGQQVDRELERMKAELGAGEKQKEIEQ